MVSTFTPNIQLEEPARGDQVGVWDTPVNANMTLLDRTTGGISVITLNNSPVVLSAVQFQSRCITFASTLTGNVTITFPSTFIKDYVIFNLCTGSSAFVVTLKTTVAGVNVICAPPGEATQVYNDGQNLSFLNLGRVGSFWDYGGSSVPAWVSGCTVAPYLACSGGTFSATTYPQLAVILGSTTLPDTRGRVRAALNQGTGRLTTAGGNVDGNTNLAGGGGESVTLASSQLPASIPYTDPGHLHQQSASLAGGAGGMQITNVSAVYAGIVGANTQVATTSITINPSGGGAHFNVQPTYIGGITMIRAG